VIRRIFRPEEKAEAVRMADECGNDRAIVTQLNLCQGSIGRWRREGFGRALLTGPTGSVILRATDSRTVYPSLRCPACAEHFTLDGEPTNANRVKGYEGHYAASPECLAKNLRRAM